MVDYREAGQQHYDDAKLLQGEGRDPNAGHLYGLSAECGIKALLVGLGHPTDAIGNIDTSEGLRGHIDHLQRSFLLLSTYVSGRSAGRYLPLLPNFGNFADWRVDHRYYTPTAIPSSLTKWATAAQEVQAMVSQAQLDGVIV